MTELLVIEDNVGDTVLIRQVVAECKTPIRLHVARDGEQALQMLDEPQYFKPDLIILDLNVPKVSGTAFLQRYRPNDVPVVVFSSSQNDAEIRHAMELGAREFVQKPIDLQAFTQTVHDIIDRWTMEGCVVDEGALTTSLKSLKYARYPHNRSNKLSMRSSLSAG